MPASAHDLPAGGKIVGRRFTWSARLTDAKQYKQVFADAKRRGDRYFTVLSIANSIGEARLGMAVPRRHTPRAVDRNRLKRLIRESFRHHRATMAARDIVVLVKASAQHADNTELTSALARHWRHLSLK